MPRKIAVAPRSGVRGLKWTSPDMDFFISIGRTPLRGAWIEMMSFLSPIALILVAPRSGVRGLKLRLVDLVVILLMVAPRSGVRGLKLSCPTFCERWKTCRTPLRGAWIEMSLAMTEKYMHLCRTPLRGAWIEMREISQRTKPTTQVAPRSGVRGLKYACVWRVDSSVYVAPRSGVRGLKSTITGDHNNRLTSHPAQGCVD